MFLRYNFSEDNDAHGGADDGHNTAAPGQPVQQDRQGIVHCKPEQRFKHRHAAYQNDWIGLFNIQRMIEELE